MSDTDILDIAHISFLEFIRTAIAQTGPAAAKGSLMRNAIAAGERMAKANYEIIREYMSTMDTGDIRIAKAEGIKVEE